MPIRFLEMVLCIQVWNESPPNDSTTPIWSQNINKQFCLYINVGHNLNDFTVTVNHISNKKFDSVFLNDLLGGVGLLIIIL